MKKIALEWLKAAHDDLMVIQAIIANVDLTHMVAFHAQQAIEKAFKAVLEEYEGVVPKVHVLETLLARASMHVRITVDADILEELDMLYLDARYPGNLGLLPAGKPDQEAADRFAALANEIFSTIDHLLTR